LIAGYGPCAAESGAPWTPRRYPRTYSRLFLRDLGYTVRGLARLPSMAASCRRSCRAPCRTDRAATNAFLSFRVPPAELVALPHRGAAQVLPRQALCDLGRNDEPARRSVVARSDGVRRAARVHARGADRPAGADGLRDHDLPRSHAPGRLLPHRRLEPGDRRAGLNRVPRPGPRSCMLPRTMLKLLLVAVLTLIVGGCATGPYRAPESANAAPPAAGTVLKSLQPDAALEDRILALDAAHVSANDLRDTLSKAPAPRIMLIHGGIYPVYLAMTSLAEFL